MPNYLNENNNYSNTPIVHIECQPSGSATMTFHDKNFMGKVMDFHRVRDAVHHARINEFRTITRKANPAFFIPNL